jgi:hypothetical protein
VVGVQGIPPSGKSALLPHWPGVPPPPQISGKVQVPQGMTPPQPSADTPQFCPAAQFVSGTQGVTLSPHWLGTPPPPQISGNVQVPQFSVRPPQPSDCWPQVPAGKLAQVTGVHSGAHTDWLGLVEPNPGGQGAQTRSPLLVPGLVT